MTNLEKLQNYALHGPQANQKQIAPLAWALMAYASVLSGGKYMMDKNKGSKPNRTGVDGIIPEGGVYKNPDYFEGSDNPMFINYQGKGVDIGSRFPSWSGSQLYTMDQYNTDKDAWDLMNRDLAFNTGLIDTNDVDIDNLTLDDIYNSYAGVDDITSLLPSGTDVLDPTQDLEPVEVADQDIDPDAAYKTAAGFIDNASWDDEVGGIVDNNGKVLYKGQNYNPQALDGLLSVSNNNAVLGSIFDTDSINADIVNENPTQVAKYQQELIDAGFDVGPSGVDSKWGPNTQGAWEAFNQSKEAGDHWYPGKYIAGGLGTLSEGIDSGGDLLMSALQGMQNLVPEENRPKFLDHSSIRQQGIIDRDKGLWGQPWSWGSHVTQPDRSGVASPTSHSPGEFDMPLLEGLLNMIRK